MSNRHILIIEDEPAIRRGLCDVLAFHGHRPTPVATGDAGLEAALTGGHDLLVLDVVVTMAGDATAGLESEFAGGNDSCARHQKRSGRESVVAAEPADQVLETSRHLPRGGLPLRDPLC